MGIVSVACFETASPRFKMPSCRTADQVAQRFLRALRVVGGMPRSLRAAKPLPVERPARVSRSFGYYGPGQLLSGTGFHGQGGRADYTVYSQIRFPLRGASPRRGKPAARPGPVGSSLIECRHNPRRHRARLGQGAGADAERDRGA